MRASLVIGVLWIGDAAAAQTVRYGLADLPRGRWTIDAQPLLEIGGATSTGPSEFAHIVGVARLGDGSLVVGDGESRELRHFGSDGRFLGRIAQKGRGPGELRDLDGLIGAGDTLIAFEGREAVTVFTTGGWVRTTPRPALSRHVVQTPQAVLSPDVTLWWVIRSNKPTIRAANDSVFLGRVEGRDTSIRLLYGLPQPPSYGMPGRPAIYPLGFAPRAHVVAQRNRICLGYSAAYEVRCLDGDARVVLRIERQLRRQAVSATAKAAFRRAESGLRSDGTSRYEGSLRAHRERVAEAARFASRYPAYSQLLLSRSGELWVRDYIMEDGLSRNPLRANSSPSRWSVFGPQGEWLAEVQLPARFAPAEVGADYVAGVAFDEDDVERVVVWRLRR